MSYNEYPTLDVSILPHSLTVLIIPGASLEEFPDFAHRTPYLKKLDINSNSISSIPVELIEGLSDLEELHIAGNPLKCDCHLREIRMLYDLCVLGVQDEPVCETPPALQGQQLLAINIATLRCHTGKRISGTPITNTD